MDKLKLLFRQLNVRSYGKLNLEADVWVSVRRNLEELELLAEAEVSRASGHWPGSEGDVARGGAALGWAAVVVDESHCGCGLKR
jgi:hypothetical protein